MVILKGGCIETKVMSTSGRDCSNEKTPANGAGPPAMPNCGHAYVPTILRGKQQRICTIEPWNEGTSETTEFVPYLWRGASSGFGPRWQETAVRRKFATHHKFSNNLRREKTSLLLYYP
jgi:hypothetical protein